MAYKSVAVKQHVKMARRFPGRLSLGEPSFSPLSYQERFDRRHYTVNDWVKFILNYNTGRKDYPRITRAQAAKLVSELLIDRRINFKQATAIERKLIAAYAKKQ